MSSVSGGSFRGRGRGSSFVATKSSTASPRGASNAYRGRASNQGRRGHNAVRGAHAGSMRRGTAASKPLQRANRSGSPAGAVGGNPTTQGDWQERHQTLKKLREKERADAIRNGLMADPDKPRALADAITTVGTCQDMCPEFERVLRVVQKDVWDEETDPNHSAFARGEPEPDESRMVKKFRRSAAGNDEQLPSDLRPPHILKQTCDYLFNSVIGGSDSLAKVHHFVWDRTRAIRNDFSIQQLSKLEDLRIAIECYERIARFHIVSLHLLALPEKPYDKYDAQQEREQLDRTLISLVQYYDDCRGRFELVNEAEFRAYTIIFQLRSPTPDLEDRVQSWPDSVVLNSRVQKALQIYAAACNTFDIQGPLKPGTAHVIARQDWECFWQIVSSKAVSYLMACVAEIYFTAIRRMVLRGLFRASSKKPAAAKASNSATSLEWSIDDLWDLFNFDEEAELVKFCERFGFSFRERDEDSQLCLDLSSVPGKTLPEPSVGIPIQSKSSLVEGKRHGRTLPAIIDGLSVGKAQSAGLTIDEEEDVMADVEDTTKHNSAEATEQQEEEDDDDDDSLFIPEDPKANAGGFGTSATNTTGTKFASNPFHIPSGPGLGKSSPFAKATGNSGFNFTQAVSTPAAAQETVVKAPPFSFLGNQTTNSVKDSPSSARNDQPATTNPTQRTATKSPFSFIGEPKEEPGSKVAQSKSWFANSGATAQSASTFPFNNSATLPSQPSLFTFGSSEQPQKNNAQVSDNHHESRSATEPISKAAVSDASRLLVPGPELIGTAAAPSTPFQFLTPPSPSTTAGISRASEQPRTFEGLNTNSLTAPSDQQPQDTVTLKPNAASAAAATATATPGLASSQDTTSKPSQPVQAQSTLTPSQANAPASPTSSSAAANGQNLRRQSMNDWKPKTPSKLSNSFTVNDDNASVLNSRKAFPNTNEFTPVVSFAQDNGITSNRAPRKDGLSSSIPAPQAPSIEAIVTRLAEELMFDPIAGLLKQFTDFAVGRVVTEVQEALHYAQVSKEADDFRNFSLSYKFGRKWRDICRHRRLAKQGQERRRRTQRRLQQPEHTHVMSAMTTADDASVLGSSRASSLAPLTQSRHEQGDTTFHSTSGTERGLRNKETTADKKRSAMSIISDADALTKHRNHKRFKSEGAVDNTSSTTVESNFRSDPNASGPSRSSFLGFSLASNAPSRGCTTHSTYFRMKALGIRHGVDATVLRGMKRLRSESLGALAPATPAKRAASSLRSSPESFQGIRSQPTSSSATLRSKASAEDEALFARIRAARDSLREGTKLMKSEVDKDEQFRTSTGSASSNESPSMILARAEARMRASRAEANPDNSRDVPAYRLRESRFVPRDQYPRAVERAREIRASRSRESSRPASRLDEHRTDSSPVTQPHLAVLPTTSGYRLAKDEEDQPLFPTLGMTGPINNTDALRLGGVNAPVYKYSTSHMPDAQPVRLDSGAQHTALHSLTAPNRSFMSPTSSDKDSSTHMPQAQKDPNGFSGFSQFAEVPLEPPAHGSVDYTLKPSQTSTALRNSFGQGQGTQQTSFSFNAPDSTTATQSQSLFASQLVGKTDSVHSKDIDPITASNWRHSPQPHQQSSVKKFGSRGTFAVQEDGLTRKALTNPFAVLANETEREQSSDEEAQDKITANSGSNCGEVATDVDAEDQDDGSGERSDDGLDNLGEWGKGHHSHGHGHDYLNGLERTYDTDADIEDFDDEDGQEDEDGELGSNLDEDEEDEDLAGAANGYHPQHPAQPCWPDEGAGTTVDEPIELSD